MDKTKAGWDQGWDLGLAGGGGLGGGVGMKTTELDQQ